MPKAQIVLDAAVFVMHPVSFDQFECSEISAQRGFIPKRAKPAGDHLVGTTPTVKGG
jgi:hypothetical protein